MNSATSGASSGSLSGTPDTWRKETNANVTIPTPEAELKRSDDSIPTDAKTLQQNLGTPALTEPVTEPAGRRQIQGAQPDLSTNKLGPNVDEMRDHDFPTEPPRHSQQNAAVTVNQRSARLGYFEEGGSAGTKPGDSQANSTVGAIMDQAETTPDMKQSVDAELE